MEYLAILGISLAFWFPAYIAGFYVAFSKLEIPKKFIFCIVCLVLSYGSIALVAPIIVLFECVSSFLVYDWTQQGRDELAYFFMEYGEIPSYIALFIPVVASFLVPFKLSKKWESLVAMYS
ncbi:hypothetical protein ACM9HF_02370 [Colwellia sp. RE-S-Sl-9]